jgi:transcription initiation factor TFIIIB Brf1 subunit/transcription initiation factor TFIIB
MKGLSNDECSVCGSDQIVTTPDSGEIVCENCGAVISDKYRKKVQNGLVLPQRQQEEKKTTKIEQECLFR